MTVDKDDLTVIFFKACDLDGEAREQYLDQACDGNPELREQVERLLEAGEAVSKEEQTHIASRLLKGAANDFFEDRDGLPESVGQFEIIGEIGAGGMSVVYEARQLEPVKRQVALKVIRPGMDTREVIARFEAERQALAMMDHVNIAKIFDGGSTEKGRPYFVMELVEGEPITDYCDRVQLDINARLELFVSVCVAIQHAHQKGVVHRDLKPSNILVSEQDHKPIVKVIDFGIAKALDVSLSDDPTETRYGQVMGTPSYMSPEQALGNITAIDTRTDVYSLGVVLYQLLVGVRPYEVQGLSGEEISQSIASDQTVRPSVKLKASAEAIEKIAEQRGCDSSELVKTISSDLDWITMRAMETEQDRRYQTANAFAHDIGNYLANRPIEARPPTRAYVLSRFVKRNQKIVAAASAMVLALAAGATMATIGLIRATKAEQEARVEQRTAEKAKEFLVSTFKVMDPDTSLGAKISASDLLKAGANRIEVELAGEPRIQGELLMTMGRAFENLALYSEAEPMLQQAVDRTIEAYGENDPKVAASYQELGEILWRVGKYDQAKSAHQKAMAIIEKQFGQNHPDYAVNQSKLGMAYFKNGEYDEAQALFKQSQNIFTDLRFQESSEYAHNLNNLGGIKLKQGDLEAAKQYFTDAAVLWEKNHGEIHPDLALAFSNLGSVHAKQGNYQEAEVNYQRALQMRRHLYDDQDHSEIAVSLNNLAMMYWRQGKVDQAGPLYQESIAIRRRVFGNMSPSVATALNNFAGVLLAQGQIEQSEQTYRESLDVRQVIQGEDHPSVAITRTNLADVLVQQEKYDEALRESSAALISLQTSLGPIHWRVAAAKSTKGSALAGVGRYLDAESLLLASFKDIRESRSDHDIYTKRALKRIVDLYEDWGQRPDELAKYLKLREEIGADW